MNTECYNINCPKHGDPKDGPFVDCDLVCPEDGLVEGAKNTKQQVQPDNGYVCNRPGSCAKGLRGKCYSGLDCPDKAIAG